MGNRKQPFGYRMELGETILHPQEAGLVEYIFHQYLSGASYNAIVDRLRDQEVPYDAGKLWNKNMIARILEDERYTGTKGFPQIISREDLMAAQEKRLSKQIPIQKTEAQKWLRRLSGEPATVEVEQQVLDLLNGLIRDPEKITLQSSPLKSDSEEPTTPQRELEEAMEQQPIDEDNTRRLILAIASAKYAQICSGEYETVRLKQVFAQSQPMEELDASLLQTSVSSIYIKADRMVQIHLKNNQVIERGKLG
jgi:hypothetical protein